MARSLRRWGEECRVDSRFLKTRRDEGRRRKVSFRVRLVYTREVTRASLLTLQTIPQLSYQILILYELFCDELARSRERTVDWIFPDDRLLLRRRRRGHSRSRGCDLLLLWWFGRSELLLLLLIGSR